jgi:hypothetical protein
MLRGTLRGNASLPCGHGGQCTSKRVPGWSGRGWPRSGWRRAPATGLTISAGAYRKRSPGFVIRRPARGSLAPRGVRWAVSSPSVPGTADGPDHGRLYVLGAVTPTAGHDAALAEDCHAGQPLGRTRSVPRRCGHGPAPAAELQTARRTRQQPRHSLCLKRCDARAQARLRNERAGMLNPAA